MQGKQLNKASLVCHSCQACPHRVHVSMRMRHSNSTLMLPPETTAALLTTTNRRHLALH